MGRGGATRAAPWPQMAVDGDDSSCSKAIPFLLMSACSRLCVVLILGAAFDRRGQMYIQTAVGLFFYTSCSLYNCSQKGSPNLFASRALGRVFCSIESAGPCPFTDKYDGPQHRLCAAPWPI
jgi:hypothetical protein